MSPAVELIPTDASADAPLLAPFNEQTGFDVADGSRRLFALFGTPEKIRVGSAVLGRGELDLHISPEFRAAGLGAEAARRLLELAEPGPLSAWSHGDHPAARALAARFGFTATRTLLQLRLEPIPSTDGLSHASATHSAPSTQRPAELSTFSAGDDDAEWLALNARVFAWHPEQGGMTQQDLDERMAEPWFAASDFLIARADDGAMIGYNWLKVEGAEGEIYVVGVAPEASGQGIGRALMAAGLARLRERGCTAATLYTEADNVAAVRLYRSLGFVDEHVDVQYSRAG
ncbi:MAG TPA: mycothiol synthase [Gryllotalpicola sp.]